MPGIPLRLDGALAKLEATYRTDPIPVAGTNGVRVNERMWPNITVDYAWENLNKDVATGTMLPTNPAKPRGRNVTIDIPWLMRGSGVLGTPPEAGPLYRASSCVETVTPATKVEYAQASQLHESCTVYCYAAGYLFKVVGCRGVVTWPITVGQPMVHRFKLRGVLANDPTAVAVPAITYNTGEPIAGVGLTMTVGAWTPRVISAAFDQGGQVQLFEDGNDADGIEEFDYGEVFPMFKLSARVPRDGTGIVDLAAYNPTADLVARTARAINVTGGSVATNRCKLVVTNSYVQPFKPAVNNTFAAYDLEYVLTDWLFRFD